MVVTVNDQELTLESYSENFIAIKGNERDAAVLGNGDRHHHHHHLHYFKG